jgi:hypothetical protein
MGNQSNIHILYVTCTEGQRWAKLEKVSSSRHPRGPSRPLGPPGSASRLPPPSGETMAAGSEEAAVVEAEVAEAASEDSEAAEAADPTEKIAV